jgi:putative ABC transport system permease protein
MTSIQDLRHGARILIRAPAFTAVAVVTLAVGIGANTAIFSVVNTLLLRPLPYADADRLAVVWEHNLPRDRRNNVVSPGNFIHWREMNHAFEDLAAVGVGPIFRTTVTVAGEPEDVGMALVSASFFPLIGVSPQLGSPFTAAAEAPDSRVAVISDRLWRRRLHADPQVLAKPLTINAEPYTVVGVMPPGFVYMEKSVDIWLPLALTAQSRTPRGRWLTVLGRLKPGIDFARAQDDMTRVHAGLVRMFPEFNTGWTARVVPLREQMTGDVRRALFVLLGAVAFVLLIACANLANLLLARATARHRELAVRAALGANRARLVRQLIAESLVLAALGGAAGLLLGGWALHLLRTIVAERVPVQRLDAVTLDGHVLVFTMVVSIGSGLLFGLLPAFASSGASLTQALKEGGRTGSSARGGRARSVFVVAQFALALVLLVGAGLLLRSFIRLVGVDAGIDARTATMRVSLPSSRYPEGTHRARFFRRVFDAVAGLPGVRAAGATSFLPLAGPGAATSYAVIGEAPPPKGAEPVADVRLIVGDYFEAMGIPLLQGRTFRADEDGRQRFVIINRVMAQRHWPNRDAIGKRIRLSWNDTGEDEIVGVVGDVHEASLDTAPRASAYLAYGRPAYGAMTLAVRAAGDPDRTAAAVARIIREQDPQLAVSDIRTMEDVISISVAERRLTTMLLGIFAAAALVLAAVGIYGVIAYTVTQRTQEIGIRMALGAQQGDVLKMVVGRAMVLALSGIGIGTAGALALTRLMSGMLFATKPADPVTFAAVAATLACVAALASYLPGRRATRVDPVIALRSE